MRINVLAGWCLILFGVINVLHEITLTSAGRGKPGIAYALATSFLFTAGAVLLCWNKIRKDLTRSGARKIE